MELYKSLVLPPGPRGSFPVILGHCIYSHVLWRGYEEAQRLQDVKEGKPQGEADSPFYTPVAGYFCYGYGGGTVRDWAMAQPPAAFTNGDVLLGWVWGYIAIHFTNDTLYNMCKAGTAFNPIKGIVMGLDAIDTAGGVCASVDKAAKLFPDNPQAPFLGGMLISLGGSLFRYMDQKARGKQVKTEWAKPTAVFKRGLFYTLLYLSLKKWSGDASWSRLTVVTMHLIRVMMSNAAGIEILPFLV